MIKTTLKITAHVLSGLMSSLCMIVDRLEYTCSHTLQKRVFTLTILVLSPELHHSSAV